MADVWQGAEYVSIQHIDLPSQYLHAQMQQLRHQNKVRNMFKANNKDTKI